jgi:LruC domain-containing protein
VKAFLCRKEGNEYWEVHPPYEAPSPKVKTSYFGTYDDCSDYAKKKNFYTSKGEYPFGFYLDQKIIKMEVQTYERGIARILIAVSFGECRKSRRGTKK